MAYFLKEICLIMFALSRLLFLISRDFLQHIFSVKNVSVERIDLKEASSTSGDILLQLLSRYRWQAEGLVVVLLLFLLLIHLLDFK